LVENGVKKASELESYGAALIKKARRDVTTFEADTAELVVLAKEAKGLEGVKEFRKNVAEHLKELHTRASNFHKQTQQGEDVHSLLQSGETGLDVFVPLEKLIRLQRKFFTEKTIPFLERMQQLTRKALGIEGRSEHFDKLFFRLSQAFESLDEIYGLAKGEKARKSTDE